MSKCSLFIVFIFLTFNVMSQNNDVLIEDTNVNIFGYLCRYLYKIDNEIHETCIFLPSDENNIDEILHNKLVVNNGKMLFEDVVTSYIFNEYIHKLNYYVIYPIRSNLHYRGKNKYLIKDMLDKLDLPDIPENIDTYKVGRTLYNSDLHHIDHKSLKNGIYLIYFGRQKINGITFSINNAKEYLPVNDNFKIDIKRGNSTKHFEAKYHEAKDNRYIIIEYMY
ncbi:hypothetical protein [Vallitalea sp.]|uniref:hypothetical protein n=1 Tax=Vallitalea sp. TaxID=1882829 RepID=UPI0025DC04B0|nr:hypothetical protein [Vallitalea sp.]MCT4685697.1 hypothetical protein [Vallitalea sp.]